MRRFLHLKAFQNYSKAEVKVGATSQAVQAALRSDVVPFFLRVRDSYRMAETTRHGEASWRSRAGSVSEASKARPRNAGHAHTLLRS
jgi:hypothetical protein